MTTHPPTSAEQGGLAAGHPGAGLPDEATVARWANELFRALPGAVPSAPTAPEIPPVAAPPAPLAVDPATGTFPGGGGSVGSSPSPATVPTTADAPTSLTQAPTGPAAVPPQLGGTTVLPGAGPTPTTARPSAVPTFYFLAGGPPVGFGVPGELDPGIGLAPVPLPPSDPVERHRPASRSTDAPAPAVPAWDDPGPGVPADRSPEAPGWYFLTERPGIEDRPTHRAGSPVQPRPQYDLHAVRRDFPILSERVDGKQLVWFDNAATTQKPRSVIERLSCFYEHENSNIHRAAHTLAARATDAYEGARDTVARFLGADAEEIVFVRGTTEAINLVAATWGRQHLGEGDEIVISHLEHHANIVPWQLLAQERGFTIVVIPVDDRGQLLLDQYTRLITERTKLVSVTQVSNALGTITPVKEIIDVAHRHGARVLVDGAQSVAHLPVDVHALDVDFFVFSGHKIYGPTGIGALYGKREVLADLPPYQGGGNMIADVTLERSLFQPPPGRFEAGTGNIADAVGLGAALDYVSELGLPNIAQYEHDLLTYATDTMLQVPGLTMIGTAAEKASVLSFVLDGYSTSEVGEALSREGIAVRSGHHCAQPILRRFGLETTERPSLALSNTPNEVDEMVVVLHRLAGSRRGDHRLH
ncbi:MAG TPA: family 2A encapsulin nanocompartment cargo protein cysteine desulfurase [Microlunatus sp.]|nr:family 2A encapsulin nanocompartment cargo protein cysteine desulfurase [Microlunatus sp.]